MRCYFSVHILQRSLLTLLAAFICFLGLSPACMAQPIDNRKYGQEDKFRQLEEILPTPNGYRNAAGEPGPEYWQQNADYVIDVTLDDEKQRITGRKRSPTTTTRHTHSATYGCKLMPTSLHPIPTPVCSERRWYRLACHCR